MPVSTQCQEYIDNSNEWEIVRDCIAGETAIKKGGEAYLKKPAGQSLEDYENYKSRAHFFAATGRTAEGLHGHIFAKDPVQAGEVSEAFKTLLKDVDAAGTSLDQFASNVAWDALATGWGGILVDHVPVPEGTPLAEKNGGAFLKWYSAESIINWRREVINGVNKLARVVLREDREVQKTDDEFVYESIERYRVLSFDESGNYIQRIFEKVGGEFVAGEPVAPKINGQPFREIPFFTCPGEAPEKSMLLGLAIENIGHYQKTADYENGLHYTGVPTPIAENMEQPYAEIDGKSIPITIRLGGSDFKFFCQKNSDGSIASVNVKYLEFSGAGLGQLLQALNACLDRMAKLGIQAIGSEKKGVETAEVAQIHRASENGVLGAFARNMSDKLTQATRLMAVWNAMSKAEADGWAYELNTHFNNAELSAQITQIMYQARMSNELPRSVWFRVLKEHGYIPEDMTYDGFLEEIEADGTAAHGVDGDEPAVNNNG
jgi:hypothetical protein